MPSRVALATEEVGSPGGPTPTN